ncbi:hypothetical protein ACFVYP_04060 [Kitasatospora sp. NPDC058201]|uniref:hypothetical protein n=1 Tax=unclassified Kitasatospora TaxID=2633591 RepID=UPI003659B9BF
MAGTLREAAGAGAGTATYTGLVLAGLTRDPGRVALRHGAEALTAAECLAGVHRPARALPAFGFDPARFGAAAARIAAELPSAELPALGRTGPGTDLLEPAAPLPAEPVAPRFRPEDAMAVRFTGGSTGRPKGGLRRSVRPPRPELVAATVRTPSAMQGYWRDPELTARVLRDGLPDTGDPGSLDGAGYLTVAGRRDSMAIVDAHNVFPPTSRNRCWRTPRYGRRSCSPRPDRTGSSGRTPP